MCRPGRPSSRRSRPCWSAQRWKTLTPARPSSTTRSAVAGRSAMRTETINCGLSGLQPGRPGPPHPDRPSLAPCARLRGRPGAARSRPCRRTGTTNGSCSGGSSEASAAGITARELSSSAAAARAAARCSLSTGQPGMSRIAGSWISSRWEGGVSSLPSGANRRRMGLGPMSTEVEMYSRPWMPSRVGRTISDMSVQMESKPGPWNRPR